MMKRKKWSELEEQTLLTKYSDLLNSGTLAKLKTREKKFKPIADHVNSIHHLRDTSNFPFKWTWRDVSIKVQNMRHQYLGVKQKIRISDSEFNWDDGENHWENFLKYKEVFGDVELEVKGNGNSHNNCNKRSDPMQEASSAGGVAEFFEEEGGMGLNFGIDSEEMDEEEEEEDGEDVVGVGISDGELGAERGERNEIEDSGFDHRRKWKKGFDGKRFRMVGAQVVELRDVVLRREEKRREREWTREEELIEREQNKKEKELVWERRNLKRDEDMEMRELELEERQMMWARRELERRVRLEREIDEERRSRMRLEERWEEEKMEWKEKMVGMQLEHEKQMIQMHADSCQNQLQMLGVIARLMCQFLGSASDALGGGLGTLHPQVLQNLQHPGGLGEGVKPDANSPSEFL